MTPTAEQIRMDFQAQLIREGSTNVKIIVDGPIEQSDPPTGTPTVIQTVIVEARGRRPTRFRLIWANGDWHAHKAGTPFGS